MIKQLSSLMDSNDFYEMLSDWEGWRSLYIDYETPVVERLWRESRDGGRIYLHRIHPCEKALIHPHPWPSAMLIVDGLYEMGVGYGAGKEVPPIAATMQLAKGSMYEMLDKDAWHYVKPLRTTYSLMITGKPWNREFLHKPTRELTPLTDLAKEQILYFFQDKHQWIMRGPR